MEALIVLVGFLGAGKTTLMKKIINEYVDSDWNPYIILNDYENANLDAQDFLQFLDQDKIQALSGSCICCSGVSELRQQVNNIPQREKGITFIEANGTTDASSLMGFLGVGLKAHFLPPIQIAVVDVRHWQKRGWHNQLEANQVQVSSLIVLNYTQDVEQGRVDEVKESLMQLNPTASIVLWDQISNVSFVDLVPSENNADKMDHQRSHWSSCSVDLPDPISGQKLYEILNAIPESVLRVKGCTRLDDEQEYSYFERTPTGETFVKPYNGTLVTGPKLLTIGPGSDPAFLQQLIKKQL